ncbi:MAG: hypothetical protein JO349_04785 [Candidatus Eremiobacteraeota bacterium]|nr:hypothetical protein [Candidatus Eremiobacteraeota bacterium]
MSRSSIVRAALGALVCCVLAWQPIVACASPSGDSTTSWPIATTPASSTDANAADPFVVAQSSGMPQRPKHIPLWKNGWDYTLDFSIATPLGNTGIASGTSLPGNMDVIARYGFGINSRLVLGYYGLQEYPVGFSTGIVPVYLQGSANPIGTANLNINNAVVNNAIFTAHYDQVFWTKIMGEDFPLVLSPTYTHRWGTIGGGTDFLPVEEQGLPYVEHYRTGQFWALGLTFPLPFLTQPHLGLVTTYTIAPQWTAGRVGANAVNTAQTVQILHAIWHPTSMPQLQFDFEPSLYPNYLPTDIYPQHYLTAVYAVSYAFGKHPVDRFLRYRTEHIIPFVQAVISMGGAINRNQFGITALYCQALPCTSPTTLSPSLGGNHAAQFQFKVGIGHPDVIPL